jgi:single-stranded-DNA-specific exonuclease
VPPGAERLRAEAGLPAWLAEALARRGVTTAEEARRFLEPSLEDLHDPCGLAGLAPAIQTILAARARGTRVAVLGDYDVDGITGTAILVAVLRACGLEVLPIVPHRAREGYGFHSLHADRAHAEGCGLLITVDCGTTSSVAAARALALGLAVIVTDHHLPGDKPLPPEVVLINPWQEGCGYPFRDLSGAAIALKLALAFAQASGRQIDPRLLLRVACLGTICDLVPLLGENRTIASIGLMELGRTSGPGLSSLLSVANLRSPVSSEDVAFRIGPRLNAPGRLDSAEASLELLLTRDTSRALELAEQLDIQNKERQTIERQVTREAKAAVATDILPPILVAWSEAWHPGVVGIAAGRLARIFNRPTILFAIHDGHATGSGRSIPGIHLQEFIARWSGSLLKFGGHSQAIGLSAPTVSLSGLAQEWTAAAAEEWSSVISVHELEYEIELPTAQLDQSLYSALSKLEPFGQGNQNPLIRVAGPLRLGSPLRHFGNGHISGHVLGPDQARIAFVGWDWSDRAPLFEGSFELLGRIEQDRYRGGFVLRLVDAKPYKY